MHEPREELRQRLHGKIARLPRAQLQAVEAFVDGLHPGGSTLIDASAAAPNSHEPPPQACDWPRAPLHRISEKGTYFVTCGTLHKLHLFRGQERLRFLEDKLLTLASQYEWHLEAWAVFSNHYHFVGHSSGPDSLSALMKHLHGDTARYVNALDAEPERTVWHNFWDTRLTFERSYLARLNYVHQNAVKHGLVKVANQYPYCSAAWFERTATPAQVKTIYGFRIDRINVPDDTSRNSGCDSSLWSAVARYRFVTVDCAQAPLLDRRWKLAYFVGISFAGAHGASRALHAHKAVASYRTPKESS